MTLPIASESLLIVGGDSDPNIASLVAAGQRKRVRVQKLLFGRTTHPSFTWDVKSGESYLDSQPLKCSAAFVRHDVFTWLEDGQPSTQYRALAWHSALIGWLGTHPEIQLFNRAGLNQVTNKPLVLAMARSCGLDVPSTLITNDVEGATHFHRNKDKIVKPINGGGYCEPLEQALRRTPLEKGRAAAPAIVQPRLTAPEIRVYCVGKAFFTFRIISTELDYRTDEKCALELEPGNRSELVEPLQRLLAQLGLNFAAADFKTCPESNRLLFLEVNTGPMFAAFDQASGGRLCESMIAWLSGGND